MDERLYAYRIDFPSTATDAPTASLLFEREIKDWRQGVRAGWKLGSGLLLYNPKNEADIFVIEDVLNTNSKQMIEIPKSQLEVGPAAYGDQSHTRLPTDHPRTQAFAFHQDMLFTVSVHAEPEAASAVLHIFTAPDIRNVLQAAGADADGDGDGDGKRVLALPPEQWSRKYRALHPLVPRLFSFEFRSNAHTRGGHIVFRASGAGEGPEFYWTLGQVRWSIETSGNENENEVSRGIGSPALLAVAHSLTRSSQFAVKAESCYELVIVSRDSGAPPTPVKLQNAEERGAIHVDKFKDSLPGFVPSLPSLRASYHFALALAPSVSHSVVKRCFHVLRPLVQPVDGAEIVEQCFPILLPTGLRKEYINGATICDVHFDEEDGCLLVGTMSEVWAMYYV